ncbi:type II toxin-antitoxin system HipA family toxin [Conexibacter sp. JD483]|uniref:type II toxin-antitoxin system HipA family toxin n=1 Tax=unclassified Conexibacter TaxID=2627773 RepID=UPI00271AF6E5|nr:MULTISPECIES: type II toxin-antitoxin system HipA family toxin [unclassified Conexibacter]MDO8188459.1 type II toxin-antitoxin system HipA family toxin [Conexibacter sp. CPCC 205706]MDO8199180.1 type II toxin-antitoxin system HipA family toxin [Conexibacter sp. CPCC 205762]MDR9371929.1 type II toxin-antitoxin system HipA family toxin [Conexibacter sp. JD483]
MTLASVRLWGTVVGAVSIESGRAATFQYDPAFTGSGIELSPLVMPLRTAPYSFPTLARSSFNGLPGLTADSLPDRYGNALIDAWLASQGRTAASFDPVERLCYVGRRGMGALEYAPARGPRRSASHDLHIAALVALASDVLSQRGSLTASLDLDHREAALREILSVGTSAGGARAKALIAWNPETGAVRSGQLDIDPGFSHWLLKFDGVATAPDRETLTDPQGFGAIELAYAQMARDAGIEMTECRLLEENGRRHFMTKRFDRTADGGKLHMQSLAALLQLDFEQAGAHSYEQAFQAIRLLELGAAAAEQQFRRMCLNVVARNQDDHVKNIAFLMDRSGRWRLSPAFDVAYAFNPSGRWTARHQMSLAGKHDRFTLEDFRAVGTVAGLKRGQAVRILGEVVDVVSEWRRYAAAVDVAADDARRIEPALRLRFPAR